MTAVAGGCVASGDQSQKPELSPQERVEMTIQSLRYGASDLLKLRMDNETADEVERQLGDIYAVNGVLGAICEDIRTNLPAAAE